MSAFSPNLPTPVSRQQTNSLSELVLTAFGTATAVQRAQTAAIGRSERREDLLTEQEASQMRVRIGELGVQEAKQRVNYLQARIVNQDITQELQEAAELENVGLIKLVSQADPMEANQFLNKYKFIDPKNRAMIMRHHAKNIATTEKHNATLAINENYNSPNPQKMSASGMSLEVLAKYGGLPDDARVIFQEEFVDQMGQLILSHEIAKANELNKRNAAADQQATQNDFGRAVIGEIGVANARNTFAEQRHLTTDEQMLAKSELVQESQYWGDAFRDNVGTVEDLGTMEAAFAQLPPEVQERLPGIRELFRLERGRRASLAQQDEDKRIATRTQELSKFDAGTQMNGLQGLLDEIDEREIPDERKAALKRPVLVELAAAEQKYDMERQLRADNVDEDTINQAHTVRGGLGEAFGGAETLGVLRRISRLSPAVAERLVSNTLYEDIGRLVMRAETDEDANAIANLFSKSPTARDAAKSFSETAAKQFTIDKEPKYAPEFGASFPLTSSVQVWRDTFVIESAKRLTANPAVTDIDEVYEFAGKVANDRVKKGMTAINGFLVPEPWFGTGDDSDAIEDAIDRRLSEVQLSKQAEPSQITPQLGKTFRYGGMTYVPGVAEDSGEVHAFLEWSPVPARQDVVKLRRPTQAEQHGVAKFWSTAPPIEYTEKQALHGQAVITELNDPKKFEQLRRQYEGPEKTIAFRNDLGWHPGLPSRYVSEVDEEYFVATPTRGLLSRIKTQEVQRFAEAHSVNPMGRKPDGMPDEDWFDLQELWMFHLDMQVRGIKYGYDGLEPPKAEPRGEQRSSGLNRNWGTR